MGAPEIEAYHTLTAGIDPAFATGERAFYETRTAGQLRALMHQAWLCNQGDAYLLARSYLAQKGETP